MYLRRSLLNPIESDGFQSRIVFRAEQVSIQECAGVLGPRVQQESERTLPSLEIPLESTGRNGKFPRRDGKKNRRFPSLIVFARWF